MGLCIKIKDTVFAKYVGYGDITDTPDNPDNPNVYPVTDNLKGLYCLGGSVENSLLDRSGNGNNASVMGTIGVENAYATFTGNGFTNRIDTPITIAHDSKITAIVLFRVPTGVRSIIANYNNNDGGFALANNKVFVWINNSSVNKKFPSSINSENFSILAISLDANGYRVVKSVSDAPVELLKYTDGGIGVWKKPITIGGYRSNLSMNDNADIAFVSIHEGELIDAQLQQIFAYVRKYGEDNGLVID